MCTVHRGSGDLRLAPPAPRGAPRRLAVTLVAALAAGTGCQGGDAPPPDSPPAAGPAAPVGPRPSLSPPAGPPGGAVTVTMSGLPSAADVQVGFGTMAGYQMVGSGESDVEGNVSLTVTVPADARPHEPHYVFVSLADQRPLGVSDPFLVTEADGTVRVAGRITDEGVECTALRGSGDELYTLAGDVGERTTGERVVVVGTVAEISTCQQGLTIQVVEVGGGGGL